MQNAITVTKNVTVTLNEKKTKLTAYVPAGMRGKTLKGIYDKNAARFIVARDVLQFNTKVN